MISADQPFPCWFRLPATMSSRRKIKQSLKQTKDNLKSLFKTKGDTTRPNTPSGTSQLGSPGRLVDERGDDTVFGGSTTPLAQEPIGQLATSHPNDTTESKQSLQPVNLVEVNRGEGTRHLRVPDTGDQVAETGVITSLANTLESQQGERPDTVEVPGQVIQDEARPVNEALVTERHQPVPGRKSTEWKGLKELARALGPVTGLFGPIKEMVDVFVGCVDRYEMTGAAKVEYNDLQARLEAILQDLQAYFQGSESMTMTSSMESICGSIKVELEKIRSKLGENVGVRYLEASGEADVILSCYRRIELDLSRLSLNANWETLKGVKELAASSRVDRLSPSLSARYNSVEADVELKRQACTPDTRVRVLDKVLHWAHGGGDENIYWLNGMAGTGKTTIAYSLCDKLNTERKLAASFFCSRLREDCRTVKRIIPSIAYQLARFSLPFLTVLSAALEKDLDVHSSALHIQFEELIVKPLQATINTLPEGLVIVIDALDECENKESTGRILDILLSKAADLPVRFLVSSRPEAEIYDRMMDNQTTSRMVLHELNKIEVQVDIEKYLRAQLAPMKPSDEHIAALVAKAGILFIYAATAVRYIGYDNFQSDPHDRLRAILATSESQEDEDHEEINELYTTVLEAALGNRRLRKVERDSMRQVLNTVICARDPLTVSGLSELLRIYNADRVRAVLRPLWSVLHVVGTNELVTTLHASFPDFMFDSGRSKANHCDWQAHNCTLAEHCLERIKQTQPQFNICRLESSYLPDDIVPSIKERVTNAIPSHLLYACRYWGDHVEAGKCASTLTVQLWDFLSRRLLLWMEVLNLTKHMTAGVKCMKLMAGWCSRLEGDEELVELANDAWRFVEMFTSNAVSRSTPHIYISMLTFWPRSGPMAKHYAKFTHGPVQAEGTALDQRQLAYLATWTFAGSIDSMALSPDGRHIALGVKHDVLVVDSSSGQVVLGPLHGHSEYISTIMFSPDQTRVFAGSSSYESDIAKVIGWDTRSGDTVAGPLQLNGHTIHVNCTPSPDCTRIATGSYNEIVRLWDAENGKMLRCFETHGPVRVVAFSPNGILIAAGIDKPKVVATGVDKLEALQVWNSQTGNNILGPLSTSQISVIAFSPDNSHIIYTQECAITVHVRDVQTGQLIHEHLVTGHHRTVNVWDAHNGNRKLGTLEGHTDWISGIAFLPDGSRIISAVSSARASVPSSQPSSLQMASTLCQAL
ncbi:unnamed protein product [Rhizoctonia solani]|uniref:NACHT domain-containing protein n=1 Tax=Rhizoctonia solani TaxID=456999 RepID=A0A8H3B9F6_9AGAM|nr:unnamed protein product [Rhizoctonia solani]